MPDPRWTDETEKLVETILDSYVYGSGYMASSFTASDRDNATERILTALTAAGLLVRPGGEETCRCGVPLASHQCTHCHDDPPRGHACPRCGLTGPAVSDA